MRWCGVVCSFGVEAIGVFNSARESLMGEDVVCEGGDAKRPSQWQSGNNQVRYPHGLKASHGAARRHHV
jgi:hypothetical protein